LGWGGLLLSLCALAAAGCMRARGPSGREVRRDPNVVLAYVSCSLVPAIEAVGEQFKAQNRGKSVQVEGEEPGRLVRRIQGGEVPDVLICLGDAEIGLLEREGFLDQGSRQAIGSLRLAIVVPAGRPIAIRGPGDLRSSRVKSIAMPTPGVTSLGTDGKHVLERADIWAKIQDKLVLQKTALAALEQVAAGKVDAGIIYDPCPLLKAGGKIGPESVQVTGHLASAEERPARAHVVLHKRSPNALLAQRLIRLLQSEETKPVLAEAGLLSEAGGESQR